MINARTAEQTRPLLHQVILFIAALGRGQKGSGFRAIFAANCCEPAGDFIQRLVPRDALEIIAHSFQGMQKTVLVPDRLQDRIALGAQRALTYRVVGEVLNRYETIITDARQKTTADAAIWTDALDPRFRGNGHEFYTTCMLKIITFLLYIRRLPLFLLPAGKRLFHLSYRPSRRMLRTYRLRRRNIRTWRRAYCVFSVCQKDHGTDPLTRSNAQYNDEVKLCGLTAQARD